MSGLNDCPFCECNFLKIWGNSSRVQVACPRCGAKGPTGPTQEECMRAWNKAPKAPKKVKVDG